MATSPYSYQTAKNTVGYPSYLSQAVAKKKNTDSIYATPLTSPGSSANPAPIRQPVSTPAPAHVTQPVTHTYSTFDYHTDPIMQQINAVSTKSRGDAEAAALAAKKQIALQYGDPALANQIGDTATADAASQNPYGAFTQLKQTHETNAHNLDENLNARNLYFSGARIKQQGDLASEFGRANADLTANEQAALGATDQAKLAAFLAADQQDAQANQDAAMRALQQALLNPPAVPPLIAGATPGYVGDYTGYGGAAASGYLTPGYGGGADMLGDANRPSYIGPDGTTVSPLTNRSLGYTPEAIPDGLVQPPKYPATPAGLKPPADPYAQTEIAAPSQTASGGASTIADIAKALAMTAGKNPEKHAQLVNLARVLRLG